MNAVSIRGDWVGQVIDGRYPLLEWLGGSGTSGTFLTESDGLGSRKAATRSHGRILQGRQDVRAHESLNVGNAQIELYQVPKEPSYDRGGQRTDDPTKGCAIQAR